MNASIPGRLIEQAARLGDQPAIIEPPAGAGDRISFGALARRVARLGAGMRAAGIGPGGRVLIFVPMSIDLYVAVLGAMHAGATVVLLDAWSNRRRLEAAVRAARPDLFLAIPLGHALRLFSPALRSIPHHWMAGRRRWRLERFERAGDPEPARIPGSSPALITFTTGSTGAPKATPRSHDLLWAQHLALANHLGLASSDVDLPTLPVFVLNNLALGVTSVLPDFNPARPAEFEPERIAAQIRMEGITTSSGSPAFYQRLAEWAGAGGRSLGLRLWTGGAPVYPRLARELDRLAGGQTHIVYGSSEAEPIAGIAASAMTRSMDAAGPQAGLCCGAPVPEIDVRIVRAHDGPIELGPSGWSEWEVPAGATGEIVVAGDHVVGAYLGAPEETLRHKIRDGDVVWHRTGDAGRLAQDGSLWLMGRVAHRVVRSGVTWWSVPAELKALDLPWVRHAAYFGAPDPGLGQRAVLCVEAAPPGLGGAPERLLAERLAPIPVDEVHLLKRIPRDPRHASKTDLEALRRRIGVEGARPMV